MKIGVIVDGSEEQGTLGMITSKIVIENVQIIQPLFASLAPKATPLQIAKAAESRIKILQAKGVNRIVLSIDLEDLNECPGVRAMHIENAFIQLGYNNVHVVLKARMFENWLIADVENLKANKTYEISKAMEQKLRNADAIPNAVKELNNLKTNRKHYNKCKDGNALAKNIDPYRIAANSRSFRKFLKVLGHPDYC